MVSNKWKPDGYPSVSTYLMADKAAEVVEFVREVFGATEHRRMERPGGGISHVELRIEDSVVMLSEATADYPAVRAWLHVYVPDVDATYALALKAGGESVQAPLKKDDPDKRGGVMDPGGNIWWISTQMG